MICEGNNFLKGLLATGVMSGTQAEAFAGSGASNTSTFNVRDFGATGDGHTNDTAAVQKALDAAGEISGTVFFPSGTYACGELLVRPHTTLLADPQWGYRETCGAVIKLADESADCLLNITGAFGVHLRGLSLLGIRSAKKKIHGIFLNNREKWSSKEDTVVIDDCNVDGFSGNGIYLLRIWLFIVRHSIMHRNEMCGLQIRGWDGFVLDNQFAGNKLDGFGADGKSSTIMFTANRVEFAHRYGVCLENGDALNVTGNCFDHNFGAALFMDNMRCSTVSGNVFRFNGNKEGSASKDFESSQCIFEKSSGIAFTANSGSIWKYSDTLAPDGAPRYAITVRGCNSCIFDYNAFYKGFTTDFVKSEGDNKSVEFKYNVESKSEPSQKKA